MLIQTSQRKGVEMTWLAEVRVRLGRSTIIMVLVAPALSCAEPRHRPNESGCSGLAGVDSDLLMWSDDSTYTIGGSIRLDAGSGTINAVAQTPEGAREPIRASLDSLSLHHDSLSFRFAPIGIQLLGRCLSDREAAGEFTQPQPPFTPITGRWIIRPRPK